MPADEPPLKNPTYVVRKRYVEQQMELRPAQAANAVNPIPPSLSEHGPLIHTTHTHNRLAVLSQDTIATGANAHHHK
jgi:hypothetical protein